MTSISKQNKWFNLGLTSWVICVAKQVLVSLPLLFSHKWYYLEFLLKNCMALIDDWNTLCFSVPGEDEIDHGPSACPVKCQRWAWLCEPQKVSTVSTVSPPLLLFLTTTSKCENHSKLMVYTKLTMCQIEQTSYGLPFFDSTVFSSFNNAQSFLCVSLKVLIKGRSVWHSMKQTAFKESVLRHREYFLR